MAQSLVSNYVHIVFATKYRTPLIIPSIETELYGYIAGVCTKLNCVPKAVGGFRDHVHILCVLSKNIAIATLLEEVKKSSSRWIKTKGSFFEDFYWQNGYGAFSVSRRHVEAVQQYIANQHAHHTNKGFQDEYRSMLTKNQVDFDERYVWD